MPLCANRDSCFYEWDSLRQSFCRDVVIAARLRAENSSFLLYLMPEHFVLQ